MKKIKRTITIRKVEITGSEQHKHENNIEICPLCHSPLSSNDSYIESSQNNLPELEGIKEEVKLKKL